MTINPYVQDLYGREVDGWYWQLTEEAFQEQAEAFQGFGNWRAAAIVDRLVATTDDVPAQVMAEYQGLWDGRFDDSFSRVSAIGEAMMAEIGRGTFTPIDATAFIVEFICRTTGTRPS